MLSALVAAVLVLFCLSMASYIPCVFVPCFQILSQRQFLPLQPRKLLTALLTHTVHPHYTVTYIYPLPRIVPQESIDKRAGQTGAGPVKEKDRRNEGDI